MEKCYQKKKKHIAVSLWWSMANDSFLLTNSPKPQNIQTSHDKEGQQILTF